MKKIAILLLTTLLSAAWNADAQTPGAAGQTPALSSSSTITEILSAIDVVDLREAGRSDADIAERLSTERGYDRQAALKKGNTDQQVIEYLITSPRSNRPVADAGKSQSYRVEGDKAYRELRYGQAAKEYTRAIEYSGNSYELYISRANTYKQYLTTTLNPAIQSNSDEAKKVLLDKSRTLLCRALYSDCETAKRISRQKVEDIQAEINVIRSKMAANVTDYETSYDVNPYYKKSAQKTHNFLQLRRLNHALKAANQDSANMLKALPDYKSACDAGGGSTR